MGDVDADIATVERLYTVTAATKLSPTSVLFETSMPNQAARPVASVAVLSSAATHHHLIHACTPMHIGPRQLRREHRRSATDPEERVGFRCRPYPIPFPPSQAVLIADGVAKLVVVEDGALVWSAKLCASNVDCAAISVDSDEAHTHLHSQWSRTPRDLTRRSPATSHICLISRARPSVTCHDLPQAQQLLDKVNTELVPKQSSRRQLQAEESCFNPGGNPSQWIDKFLETFDCACLAGVVEGSVAGVHKGPRPLHGRPSVPVVARLGPPTSTTVGLWLRERWTLPANRPPRTPSPRARRYKETCAGGICEETMFCADACGVVCPEWKQQNCAADSTASRKLTAGRGLGVVCPCLSMSFSG